MVDYKILRNLYYVGIMLLVLYALPGIKLIENYLYPIYECTIFPGLSVISFIAIAIGVLAFLGWKYRRIG